MKLVPEKINEKWDEPNYSKMNDSNLELISKSNVIGIIERYKNDILDGAKKNYKEQTPTYNAEISKASLLSLIIRDIERRS